MVVRLSLSKRRGLDAISPTGFRTEMRGRRALSVFAIGALIGILLSFCLLWHLPMEHVLSGQSEESQRAGYASPAVSFRYVTAASQTGLEGKREGKQGTTQNEGADSTTNSALWLSEASGRPVSGRRLLVFLPLLGTKYGATHPSRAREEACVRTWGTIGDWAKSNKWGTLRIVGMVEHEGFCDPALEVLRPVYSCVVVPPSCTHPTYKVLRLDCLFQRALELSPALPPHYPSAATLFFSNADVLFTPDVLRAVSSVDEHFEHANFTIVGQRIDLNTSALAQRSDEDVARMTVPQLLREFMDDSQGSRIHSPMGIDYFILPPAAFPRDFPPFLVGRWKWDNALLYALLRAEVPIVDATEAILALHLGLNDATSKAHIKRVGADYNDRLVNQWLGRAHLLGRIDNSPYYLQEDEAGDGAGAKRLVVRQRERVQMPVQMMALRRAAPLPNSPSKAPFIIVLFVSPGQARQALHWVCNTQAQGLSNYLVLTVDYATHMALLPHIPDAILLRPPPSMQEEPSSLSEGLTTTSTGHPVFRFRRGGGRPPPPPPPPPSSLNLLHAEVVNRLLRYNLTVVTSRASVLWGPDLMTRLHPQCHVTSLPPDFMASPGPFLAIRPAKESMHYWAHVGQCLTSQAAKRERRALGKQGGQGWDGGTKAERLCMSTLRSVHRGVSFCSLSLVEKKDELVLYNAHELDDAGGSSSKRRKQNSNRRPWAVMDGRQDEAMWSRGRGNSKRVVKWDDELKGCIGFDRGDLSLPA